MKFKDTILFCLKNIGLGILNTVPEVISYTITMNPLLSIAIIPIVGAKSIINIRQEEGTNSTLVGKTHDGDLKPDPARSEDDGLIYQPQPVPGPSEQLHQKLCEPMISVIRYFSQHGVNIPYITKVESSKKSLGTLFQVDSDNSVLKLFDTNQIQSSLATLSILCFKPTDISFDFNYLNDLCCHNIRNFAGIMEKFLLDYNYDNLLLDAHHGGGTMHTVNPEYYNETFRLVSLCGSQKWDYMD